MTGFRKFRKLISSFLPKLEKRRQLRDHLLRRVGLARTFEPALFIDHPEWRTGNLLRYIAADHLLRHGQLTFLQIGAYDGIVGDDLCRVIENENVQGVFVEPQPAPFSRLQERYRGNPKLTLINAAIDKTSGLRTLYTMPGGDCVCASFTKEHLLKHGASHSDIEERSVRCLTIDEVIQSAGLPTIDLLQIDAEGYDYEIIKSLNFELISPAIVRFEFRHLSANDIRECLHLLAGHGYRFLVENFDLIAVREAVSSGNGSQPVRSAA